MYKIIGAILLATAMAACTGGGDNKAAEESMEKAKEAAEEAGEAAGEAVEKAGEAAGHAADAAKESMEGDH